MTSFTDQVILVSGATRGIGQAIAEGFLERGGLVIGLYAGNTAAAEIFAQKNQQFSSRLELLQCDIADERQVISLFQKLEKRYARLDVLINNAGIRRDAVLAMMDAHSWQEVLDVNLTGTFLMCKQAVRLMLGNRYGRIVNITSPVARLGFAGQANYAASKAGLIALSKSLSKETAKKKITVNCVSPGFIETEFIKDLSDKQLSEYKKMIPMKRFGTPEEVAQAVLYLASRHASYITGAVLEVTGGI